MSGARHLSLTEVIRCSGKHSVNAMSEVGISENGPLASKHCLGTGAVNADSSGMIGRLRQLRRGTRTLGVAQCPSPYIRRQEWFYG